MKRAGVLRFAAAAGVLAGIVPPAARAATALRLATIPIDTGAQMYYADANGTFRKHGLDTTVQSITNGAAIIAATLGNAVDIGFANIVSLAVAYKRGLALTIVAPAAMYSPVSRTSALIVLKDSPIKTAADCAGKTIGVSSLNSITQYSTQAWLDKNGGDAKSARFIEMPFPQIAPALVERRIDIGHFAEPALTDARKIGRTLAESYEAIAPTFMIAAFFAQTSFVRSNAKIVRQFSDAIRESAVWANAHHGASGDILAKVTKMDPATVTSMVRAEYALTLSPESIQPSIDVAVKYGGLAPFDAHELITNRPA
jgi:NitT/TauT family transport system substrate-binding protein